jgi:kynurenine formamidase
MKLVDLSHPLIHGQDNFPSDPKLTIVPHGTVKSMQYNISQISMSSHQGTHLDAMYHFIDSGKTIDQMPLEWFYGEAHLLNIPKKPGEEIRAADFMPFEHLMTKDAKIIFNTGWHDHFGREDYFSQFPSLTIEAAEYIARRNIRMLGMDTPTPGRDFYEIHHILLGNEIVIVEGLNNLAKLPSTFTFIGFPLNFSGRDGSPIRAVALLE